MRKVRTCMIMLPKSESALSDCEMKKICNLLKAFPEDKYFISIYPTQLNPICSYTTAITVLDESVEAAQPICYSIIQKLKDNGEYPEYYETFLLYGNDAPHFFSPIT